MLNARENVGFTIGDVTCDSEVEMVNVPTSRSGNVTRQERRNSRIYLDNSLIGSSCLLTFLSTDRHVRM
jgi:hypothetical protein